MNDDEWVDNAPEGKVRIIYFVDSTKHYIEIDCPTCPICSEDEQ